MHSANPDYRKATRTSISPAVMAMLRSVPHVLNGNGREPAGRDTPKDGTPGEIQGRKPISRALNPQLLPEDLRGTYGLLQRMGFTLRVTLDGEIIPPDLEAINWGQSGLSSLRQKEVAMEAQRMVGLTMKRIGKERSEDRRRSRQPTWSRREDLDIEALNEPDEPRVEAEDDEYRLWVEEKLRLHADGDNGTEENIQMSGIVEPERKEDSTDGEYDLDIHEGRVSIRDQLRRL